MPTVVLLDNSLSMRRRASIDELSKQLLSVAVQGLSTFFTYMKRCFPLEHCALLTFSSSCEILSPFTRDYDELRQLLDTVSSQDRSDLTGSLYTMAELIVAEWGSFAPCQVVLVTDGRMSLSSNRPNKSLPFPCNLHLVCFSQKSETQRLQSLFESLRLSPSSMTCLPTPLTESSVVDAFVNIAETHFQPYTGVLKCAHLQSIVTLSPSPSMAHTYSEYEFVVGNNRIEFCGPKMQPFPEEMTICGFLDTTAISAPAVLSRHFVLDATMTGESLSKLCEQLRDEKDLSMEASSRTIQLAEKPSFRVILHGSLKCESKLALVKLSESWFGLLSSAAASSKKSNLILTVLQPDAPVPWLGPFHYLGPKPVRTDPRSSSKTTMFPVSANHTLSYQSPSHLYWVKATGVQADMGKIARYMKKLPEKEISLIKELNKVRYEALTFSFPSLMEAVCKILSAEEAVSSLAVKPMLQYYLQFLSTNHNPQEKLTPLAQTK